MYFAAASDVCKPEFLRQQVAQVPTEKLFDLVTKQLCLVSEADGDT